MIVLLTIAGVLRAYNNGLTCFEYSIAKHGDTSKKKKCPSTQQCARDGKRDRAVSSEGLSGDDSSLVDQVVRIIMVCTIIVVSLITARVRQTTKSTEV